MVLTVIMSFPAIITDHDAVISHLSHHHTMGAGTRLCIALLACGGAAAAQDLTLTASDGSVDVVIDVSSSTTFGALKRVQPPGQEGILQGDKATTPIWSSSWVTTESSAPIVVSARIGMLFRQPSRRL